MRKKQAKSAMIKSIILPLLLVGIIVCLYFYYNVGGLQNTILFSVLFFFAILLYVIGAFKGYYKLMSVLFYTILICAVILACYVPLAYSGLLEYLADPNNIQEMIGKSSPWGEIIFVLITFAQVTLVPIPSTITIVAGVVAFGLGPSILYSTLGLLIGSMFAFFLGKVFGMKIVRITIGEGMYNKYQSIMKGKDVTMLFLMFLLPLFPDDLLCIVAGLTNMTYMQFFIMMLITRPIGVAVTSVGSKLLTYIPLEGWGLVVWGVLIILVVVLAVLLMKYSNLIQDRMVSFFDTHFNRARQVKGADLTKFDMAKYNYIKDTKVYSNTSFYSSYGGRTRREAKKKAKLSR